jgi:hypothetical protein
LPVTTSFANYSTSFDHLIGAGEQSWRDRDAECLGRLAIDPQIELGRLLYRRLAAFCAIDIVSSMPIRQTLLGC